MFQCDYRDASNEYRYNSVRTRTLMFSPSCVTSFGDVVFFLSQATECTAKKGGL